MPIELVVDDSNFRTGISDPVCSVSVTIDVTDVSTEGGADGEASAVVSGAVGDVTYVWSNGETTQTITGLSAGQVYVTVYDDGVELCNSRSYATVKDGDVPPSFMFSSVNDTASTFTIDYTGTGTPMWYDGIDSYTGNSVTFVNWNNSTQKDVSVFVEEPDKVISFGNDWTNKGLTNTLDISSLSGLSGDFDVSMNSGLTSILNPTSSGVFTEYIVDSCDLTGVLDISGLSGLGGVFRAAGNPNLTSILNPTSSELVSYSVQGCDITGTLDISGLSGLHNRLFVHENLNLTSILSPTSPFIITDFRAYGCNLTGTLDISGLSGLSGRVWVFSNPNLTSILNPTSSGIITDYSAYSCDLTGTFDVSGLSGLSRLVIFSNSNLTSILNPTSSQPFSRYRTSGCNHDYIDLSTLTSMMNINSGAYDFEDNNMVAGDVNHMLVDMDSLVSSEPPGGSFSGRSVDVGGTNAAPDSSSGGYDGSQAVINIASKGITVITS